MLGFIQRVLIANVLFLGITINSMMDNTTNNPVRRIAAEEYNKKIALNRVPKDVSQYMFAILFDPQNSVEENLRTSLVLSRVCTQLNDVSYYVTFLEKHPEADKNAAFIQILDTINDAKYFSRRKPLQLLLHAGADPNCTTDVRHSLLERAIDYNDFGMILLLSDYKANFNMKDIHGDSLIFSVQSESIARIFESEGADFHAKSRFYPNVLSFCCWSLYESEGIKSLVQFYLDKKVDPRILDERKRCLLHQIAGTDYIGQLSESYQETVILFLNLLPDLINTLDNDKKTSLDLALENHFQHKNIIELFKKYGAKTAQELSM